MNFSKTRVGIGLGDGEAPQAALDVRGGIHANGGQSWPIPCAVFSNVTPGNTGSAYYAKNIGTQYITYNAILKEDTSGTIQSSIGSQNITLNRTGMYEFNTENSLILQGSSGHIGIYIRNGGVSGSGTHYEGDGYFILFSTYNTVRLCSRTYHVLVTKAPYVVKHYMQPISNNSGYFTETAYGANTPIHKVFVKYLG